MPPFEDIDYEVTGAVARIVIARPDKLNACREGTVDEMRAALALAEADPAIRCLVVTGRGRAFGAGYDLAAVPLDQTPRLDDVLERHFNPLVAAMRQSRLPIVAAVVGPCAGASVGIALAADLVIAARDAYFLEPFVGLALVPDAGNTVFLTRMLGRVRAAGMMLLGERISADRALDWGLVWQVCERDALEAEASRIALRLASLPGSAVAATKRLIRETCEADLAERLARERDLQGEAGRGAEVKVAIGRFLGGRGG